jgi:polysaccharide biosynthesis transport protein
MARELPIRPVPALPIPPAALRAFDAAGYARPETDGGHFWDFWRILVRHRWTIVLVFLGALLSAAVWTFTSRPIFTASAMMRIDREEPRVVKFQQVVPEEVQGEPAQMQLQTFHRLLQSRALAARVIDQVGLARLPEFRGLDPGRGEMIDAFFERLRVEPVRSSRLVKVSFQSRDRELSAQVVNGLADAFIAQQLEQKREATRYASTFLAGQVDEARKSLEGAETLLNQFLKEHDILFVAAERSGDRSGDRQSLAGQQLVTMSEALLKARAERVAKESLLAQAQRVDADTLPAVLQNPLIAQLKQEATVLEAKYRELSQTFKPEYPRLARLGENVAQVRRQLAEEVRRVVEALRNDHRSALQAETELRKLMDDQQGRAQQVDAHMARYNLLRRDADTQRELYAALSARLKETRVSSALVTSNISIVDRAEVPAKPTQPRPTLYLLVGALVGILGGVSVALLFEYLDTSIRDPRQVAAVLQVPTLGLVPARAALARREVREPRPVGPFALVSHHATSSVLAEAFRGVRTSVVYATPDQPPRTLLVTSLQQQDGKTSVSTNCAISLAQLGVGDVLLIDADMRHPNLHEILGVAQAPGLSSFLAGAASAEDVVRPTKIQGLYVMPAGPTPRNPTELLASRRLAEGLAALEGRFAHIVIDTPPMLGLSDTLVLAPRVEGVVLVLRQGRTSRSAAQRAVHMLESLRARVLGVVLNHVDPGTIREAGEGYYYYRRDNGVAAAPAASERVEASRAGAGRNGDQA